MQAPGMLSAPIVIYGTDDMRNALVPQAGH